MCVKDGAAAVWHTLQPAGHPSADCRSQNTDNHHDFRCVWVGVCGCVGVMLTKDTRWQYVYIYLYISISHTDHQSIKLWEEATVLPSPIMSEKVMLSELWLVSSLQAAVCWLDDWGCRFIFIFFFINNSEENASLLLCSGCYGDDKAFFRFK